jgi:hypothetical protein
MVVRESPRHNTYEGGRWSIKIGEDTPRPEPNSNRSLLPNHSLPRFIECRRRHPADTAIVRDNTITATVG